MLAGGRIGEGVQGAALLQPAIRLPENGGDLGGDFRGLPGFLRSHQTAGGLPENFGVGVLVGGGTVAQGGDEDGDTGGRDLMQGNRSGGGEHKMGGGEQRIDRVEKRFDDGGHAGLGVGDADRGGVAGTTALVGDAQVHPEGDQMSGQRGNALIEEGIAQRAPLDEEVKRAGRRAGLAGGKGLEGGAQGNPDCLIAGGRQGARGTEEFAGQHLPGEGAEQAVGKTETDVGFENGHRKPERSRGEGGDESSETSEAEQTHGARAAELLAGETEGGKHAPNGLSAGLPGAVGPRRGGQRQKRDTGLADESRFEGIRPTGEKDANAGMALVKLFDQGEARREVPGRVATGNNIRWFRFQ